MCWKSVGWSILVSLYFLFCFTCFCTIGSCMTDDCCGLRLTLPQVTEKNIDAARESYRPVAFRDFGGERGRHKPRKSDVFPFTKQQQRHLFLVRKPRKVETDTLTTHFLGDKMSMKYGIWSENDHLYADDWPLQVRCSIPKLRNWKYIWYMLIWGGENHAAKLYQLLFLQIFYEFCHWGFFTTRTWSPNYPMAYFHSEP